MPTDRELATLLIVAALLVFIAAWRPTREMVPGLVRALFPSRLVVLYMVFLGYLVGLLMVAAQLRVWDLGLLKDTIVVGLTVGLPLLFYSVKAATGRLLARRAIRDVLGVGAIAAAYVNLASFSLVVELSLQVFVVVLLTVAAYASHQKEAASAAKLLNSTIALVGLGLIAYTTYRVAAEWGTTNWLSALRSFAMSVWLPLALLPLLYCVAFYAATELIYTRLPYVAGRRTVPLSLRLGIFWGLRFRVRAAASLVGKPLTEVASHSGFRDTTSAMRRYRRTLSSKADTSGT